MLHGIDSSPTLLIAQKSLDACVLRQEAISRNIANAETPGYKRMDISADFSDRLRAAVRRGEIKGKLPNPTLAEDVKARAQRSDGNSVDLENELLQLNKSQVDHEYLTHLIGSHYKMLKTAITGRNAT
jgi:flagellar basal-body rod protein FlgB